MSQQYVYNAVPGQNIFNKNEILYEYHQGSNPLDPLGLQGANYTIVDPSQNAVITENATSFPTTKYTTTVEQPIYQNYTQQINYGPTQIQNITKNTGHLYQNQIGDNHGKEIYYQTTGYPVQNQIKNNQQIAQPQIHKNINQQIYIQQQQNIQTNPQKYQQQNIPQKQIQIQPNTNPKIQTKNPQNYPYQNQQQKIQPQTIPQIQPQAQILAQLPYNQQYHHYQQKIQPKLQPQIQPQKNINPPQPNQQQKILPQAQPQTNTNTQPIIQNNQKVQNIEKNKIQPNINPQHQQIQPQIQGLNPAQIHYQKYIPNQYQNQNQNQIKLDYNKNDEHFVNKPIYQERKQVQIPTVSQNPKNAIKTLENNKTLIKGTIPLKTNVVNNNTNNIGLSKGITHNTKIGNNCNKNKLSEIKEEEIDIEQSGLSKKISQINNSNNNEVEKEIPIEEKKPEEVFPGDIIDENSKNNITQKSLTESGISDIDSKMDHLPTINSIMKGNSEPLPPIKKNKYGK